MARRPSSRVASAHAAAKTISAAAGATCPVAPPAATGGGDPTSVGLAGTADEARAEVRFTPPRTADGALKTPSLIPSAGAVAETGYAEPSPSATRGCEAPAGAGSEADITDSNDTSASWWTVARASAGSVPAPARGVACASDSNCAINSSRAGTTSAVCGCSRSSGAAHPVAMASAWRLRSSMFAAALAAALAPPRAVAEAGCSPVASIPAPPATTGPAPPAKAAAGAPGAERRGAATAGAPEAAPWALAPATGSAGVPPVSADPPLAGSVPAPRWAAWVLSPSGDCAPRSPVDACAQVAKKRARAARNIATGRMAAALPICAPARPPKPAGCPNFARNICATNIPRHGCRHTTFHLIARRI
jgi:hypothetical protein